jgi:hypothetical protein
MRPFRKPWVLYRKYGPPRDIGQQSQNFLKTASFPAKSTRHALVSSTPLSNRVAGSVF